MRSAMAGYSLLEVLVALAVSGLTFAALGQATTLFSRSEASLRREREIDEALAGVTRLVTALVRQIPFELTDAQRSSVVGDRSTLVVSGTGPAILGIDTPRTFELTTSPNAPGAASLSLSWRQPGSGVERREIVAANVPEIRFSYRRRDANADQWQDQWRDSVAHLDAIRIEVYEGGSRETRLSKVIPVTPVLPSICLSASALSQCSRYQQ